MTVPMGLDSKVILWHSDGTPAKSLTGHRGKIWDVEFSPDGQFLASVSADKTLKLSRIITVIVEINFKINLYKFISH